MPQSAADGPGIDLARLEGMFPPNSDPVVVQMMVHRAALGLQRNHHVPGVGLQLVIESAECRTRLSWPIADRATAHLHDNDRITEDGAEAIALSVAYERKDCRVRRRLGRWHYADWLLECREHGEKKLIAFEVSGTDQGDVAGRLRQELAQVAQSTDGDERWAGVVGFRQPEAVLQSVGGQA